MVHLLLAIIYLAFISLGLPDALLGAAWPSMYPQFDVPVSYAGIISMIIALGTVVSSLQSDRLTKKLGTGKVTALSVLVMLLPFGQSLSLTGLILIGLGCAPVYPCVIHSTPAHFGADKSQAIIGIQMACAYVGTCLMPPVFGLIANHITVALLPVYLLIILVLMVIMHELLCKKTD